jgi:hypothetical protein
MTLPEQHRLSGLQLAILHALTAALRRHPKAADGIPYSDIVRAVHADKDSITLGLRQLMRKGLILLTLPRGGWTRQVTLTEQGKAYTKTLPNPEARHHSTMAAYEIAELARYERQLQDAESRRGRRRDKPSKRDGRRARRKGE